MSVYVYLCIFMSVCLCLSLRACLRAYLSVPVCLFVPVFVCLPVLSCLSVPVWLCLSLCLSVCVCLFVSVCLCLSVFSDHRHLVCFLNVPGLLSVFDGHLTQWYVVLLTSHKSDYFSQFYCSSFLWRFPISCVTKPATKCMANLCSNSSKRSAESTEVKYNIILTYYKALLC